MSSSEHIFLDQVLDDSEEDQSSKQCTEGVSEPQQTWLTPFELKPLWFETCVKHFKCFQVRFAV